MKKKLRIGRHNREGQSTVEYLILFSVVVAAIVFGVTTFIGPSLNGLYQKTSVVIDNINPTLLDGN